MTSPHDRPTATELLEAVREWMERDLLSGIDGRLQFHTRVAMNIIDIVRREIELGPDQESRHRDMLAALGVSDDAELAASIRAGDYDGDLQGLLEHLRPIIEDKLRVANPKYLR